MESLSNAVTSDEKKSLSDLFALHCLDFVKDEICNLSILDPAMGSGHFLVNAITCITNFIVSYLNNYGLISDIDTSLHIPVKVAG